MHRFALHAYRLGFAAAVVAAAALPARAQVPYGSQGNSVQAVGRPQAGSTFNSTVRNVMPNGTLVLGNGLTVTLGGMSPFGGGAFGSPGFQGDSGFSGYLAPMVGQSVRVTTLPIGSDQPASGPVPVLMYSGPGYDSLVNQAMVQRGLARYQGQYFQAAPDVREQMRQAEVDAKNRNAGLWMGPGTGTGTGATPFETLSPEAQRKAVAEHNKRVEEAQKKAAAEAPKAPPAPEAVPAPEAPRAPIPAPAPVPPAQ